VALIDEADAERVNRYKWKATPLMSGGRSYAVRNVYVSGGKWKTVYLHRFILGYDGPDCVDHLNHNTMDNRRSNLRVVSKAVNTLNRAPTLFKGTCAWCGSVFERAGDAGGHKRRYCSDEHLAESLRFRARERNAKRKASSPSDAVSAKASTPSGPS
jgi:hypothetical protein